MELNKVSVVKDYTEDVRRALALGVARCWPCRLESPNALGEIGDVRVPTSRYHAEPGSKIKLG